MLPSSVSCNHLSGCLNKNPWSPPSHSPTQPVVPCSQFSLWKRRWNQLLPCCPLVRNTIDHAVLVFLQGCSTSCLILYKLPPMEHNPLYSIPPRLFLFSQKLESVKWSHMTWALMIASLSSFATNFLPNFPLHPHWLPCPSLYMLSTLTPPKSLIVFQVYAWFVFSLTSFRDLVGDLHSWGPFSFAWKRKPWYYWDFASSVQ